MEAFRPFDLGSANITAHSIEDLAEETREDLDDDGILQDLRLWQWARMYAGSDDMDRLEEAIERVKGHLYDRKGTYGKGGAPHSSQNVTPDSASNDTHWKLIKPPESRTYKTASA